MVHVAVDEECETGYILFLIRSIGSYMRTETPAALLRQKH